MAMLPFDTQPYRPQPGKWNQKDPSMNFGVRLDELLVRLGAKPAPIDDRRFDPFQLANMPQRIGALNQQSNPAMNQGPIPQGVTRNLQAPMGGFRKAQNGSVHQGRLQGNLIARNLPANQNLQVAAPKTYYPPLSIKY